MKFAPELRGYDFETRTYSGKEVYGQTNYDRCLIEINSSMCKSVQPEILIHEVIHAIMFHSHHRHDHDESLVQAIACGLNQLGVGKYLMEKANGEKK